MSRLDYLKIYLILWAETKQKQKQLFSNKQQQQLQKYLREFIRQVGAYSMSTVYYQV